MEVQACCPICRSDRIDEVGSALVSCGVLDWSWEPGTEARPEDYDDSEVWWDSFAPTQERRPYQCRHCYCGFDFPAVYVDGAIVAAGSAAVDYFRDWTPVYAAVPWLVVAERLLPA